MAQPTPFRPAKPSVPACLADGPEGELYARRGEPVEPVPVAKSVSATAVNAHDGALVKAIALAVAPVIHKLETRVEQLEQRLAEVERKGYVGIWKEGKEYSPQSECTHDGARWFCHKRTSDKPGTSADWSMMEKSAAPRDATASARNGHYVREQRLK
jgi:hypothetical protein